MENMSIAIIDSFDNWGEEGDENSNWSLLQSEACFVHQNDCAFIVQVMEIDVKNLKKQGFTPDVIKAMKDAQKAGFSYLCFRN
jgi:hypothetical protein